VINGDLVIKQNPRPPTAISTFSSIQWSRLSFNGAKKNRYVYILWEAHTSDKALVFAPLSNALFEIGQFSSNLIHEDKWIEQIFNMIPEQEIDDEELTRNIHSSESTHFSIGISERCNLNCIYCHSDASGTTVTNCLEYSDLDRIVDYIKKNIDGHESASISFACGGEPTIEWNKFEYTVKKIQSELSPLTKKLSLSMTTNGIYGNRRRKFIVDNFSSITLSLDGTNETHNKQRPLLSGGKSFETVIATAEYFQKHKLPFGFRSTVCGSSIGDMVDFVRYLSKEFSPVVVVFEPLVKIGRGAKMEEAGVDPWQFCETFWRAYCIGRRSKVDVRTSMLNISQVKATFCGAMSIPSITFSPTRTITGCHRDVNGMYQFGEMNRQSGKIHIDIDKLEHSRLNAMPMSKCNDCFCRWTCGGDCPDIRNVGDRCQMIRKLTFWRLLEALNSTTVKEVNYAD